MSVERIKLLLGQDKTGSVTYLSQRQMITPSMQFTCDGTITKWIFGFRVDYSLSGDVELQIWRKCGQLSYCKVNGTIIPIGTAEQRNIFEHATQIQFMAGDILGVFVPEYYPNIGAENDHGFLSYYVSTANSDQVSLLDRINITRQNVLSDAYRPLVTVEIVKKVQCKQHVSEYYI